MEQTSRTRALYSVVKDIEKGKYNLNSIIQRDSGAWSKLQKSEFIHSLLINLPVNTVYCIKREDGVLEVIDGLQRITTYLEYIKDEFSISKKIETVQLKEHVLYADGSSEISNVSYKLAAKKFSELDSEVQDTLLSCEMNFCEITYATDDEIRLLFHRLNNGTPLSNSNLDVTKLSDEMILELKKICSSPFFQKTVLCGKEKINSRDRDAILHTFMLMQYKSTIYTVSHSSLYKYAQKIDQDGSYIELCEKLDKALKSIDIYYYKKHKNLKKQYIPILLAVYVECMEENNNLHSYIQNVYDFLDVYDTSKESKESSTRTIYNSEQIVDRYNKFRKLANLV